MKEEVEEDLLLWQPFLFVIILNWLLLLLLSPREPRAATMLVGANARVVIFGVACEMCGVCRAAGGRWAV